MSNREAFEKICPAEEGVKIEWSEKRQKYYHNKIQGQLITGKYTRERDKMLRVWQSAEQHYKAELEQVKKENINLKAVLHDKYYDAVMDEESLEHSDANARATFQVERAADKGEG